MKHVYHIGLHCTDDDQIQDCLLSNRKTLADRGVCVPDPARARPVIQKAMIDLRGTPASSVQQDGLRSDLGFGADSERLILSNSSFLCIPKRVLKAGQIYPLAAERVTWIRNLFPDTATEFAIALRNPATQIPALHARFRDGEPFDSLLARIRPLDISLVTMVQQIQAAVPDADLTIWCNEDAPLIWPTILRALAGLPEDIALSGLTEMVSRLLSRDAIQQLSERLPDSRPVTDHDWLDAVTEALERHAVPEAVTLEFDLPGWTQDLIGQLTGLYEEDVKSIAGMKGVKFLQPVKLDKAA